MLSSSSECVKTRARRARSWAVWLRAWRLLALLGLAGRAPSACRLARADSPTRPPPTADARGERFVFSSAVVCYGALRSTPPFGDWQSIKCLRF
eukprot:5150619-Prymnesium_polylepis.1